MARLALAFLGPCQVTLDGAPITTFESDKVRALLVYLAVEADRPHRRDTLAGLLWPERPERAAHLNLNQALSNLRQALHDRTAAPPVLQITRESIQFNLAGDDEFDVAMFAALLDACAQHPHRQLDTCPSCLRRLHQAIALYRGDFLAQFFLRDATAFEEWALLTRERLRRRALGALARLADAYERRGEYEQVQRYAWRQLELEPWREVAHRQVIRGLALGGQRSAALEQYERCRRILAAELGVEPEPETTALHARVQCGERLEPEGAATPATNLPAHAPRTPFLGREGELAQITDRLAQRDCRLLTLVGLGGSGKTRLALQAAADHRVSFADGVYFVPLAPLSSPEFLVPAIADALAFVFHGSEDPATQLLAYLREKEMLLVLDNFEHLLDGADLLSELVQRAPAVRWLVTSRERLNLQVEWILDIAGLPVPHDADAEAVGGSSAIQLFVQTARRVQAEFALSPQTMPSVVWICRWVDGMPLAIELAASWVWAQSCDEIAQELEGSLDVLATELRDVPVRHRSMRAVFDHSWKLLSADERGVLAASPVFRGGFTRAAAEQVAGASGPLLSRLIAKAFLQRDEAGRYHLHELVRQYAAEKLQAAGEMEQVRDRHLQYFLALAEAADAGLITTESRSWVERLEQDHDNLRAAFAASQGVEGGCEIRLRFAAALWRFWFMRGLLHEGQACVDEVLAESHGVSPAWAKTLYGAAFLMWRLADKERMAALAEAGFAACQHLGDHRGMAYALICLGWAAIAQAEDQQAAACFEQSLGLFRAVQDAWGTAVVLNRVGEVLCERGEYGRAVALFEESLALFRQMGEPLGMSDALGCMAWAMEAQGDYARATALTEESLKLKRAVGDKYAIANAVCDLGYLASLCGDYTVARARYDESLRLSRELGEQRHTARILTRSGRFVLNERDAQRATGFFIEAMALYRKLEDPAGIVRCLVGLAAVAGTRRQPERAARLLGAAEAVAEATQLRMDRNDRAAYDRVVTAARSQLDAATFASAWAEGRAMVLEQAIAYALEGPTTASLPVVTRDFVDILEDIHA